MAHNQQSHKSQPCFRAGATIRLIGALGVIGLLQAQAASVPISSVLSPNSLACGDKTFSFSAFNSVGSPPVSSGGPVAPTDAEVFLTPIDCGTLIPGPGVLIQSALWNVNAGQTMDTTFTFTVVSSGAPIIDASLAFGSYGTTGDGDIHVTESITDSMGNAVANLVLDDNLGINTDTVDFSTGYQELIVTKDISLEGNTVGSATLSTLTQNFSESPEPGTISMLGLGTIGLVWATRRRREESRHIRP